MSRFRIIAFKKSYVYSVLGCAILTYIYFAILSMSTKTDIIDPQTYVDDPTYTEKTISRYDIETILSLKKQIRQINKKQMMQNIEHFGYEIALVIVIQVHDKTYYLEQLLQSLENAKGITKTLLIFSHTYCDEEINRLVRNMTFAKVMQIFYPYSVQLHPYVFPGNDNKICVNGLTCHKGNRHPLLMQRKHHWWWKASYVFDKLRIIRDYNGSVLFLEEDQYVTKDFIFVLKVLERLVSTSYPHCDVISLGGDKPNVSDYHVQDATAVLKLWTPREHLGILFNRDFWVTLRELSEHYCRYNDDRWINSLIHLGSKSSLGNFYVLSLDSPRVLAYSDCVTYKGQACGIKDRVEHVKTFVKRIQRGLFPHNMIVTETSAALNLHPNGGWSDARDQELCLFYTNKMNLVQ